MEDRFANAGFKFCIQYLGHHGPYRHDRRVAIRESAPIGPVGQQQASLVSQQPDVCRATGRVGISESAFGRCPSSRVDRAVVAVHAARCDFTRSVGIS